MFLPRAKKPKESVLPESGTTRLFMKRIQKCQTTLFGHMMRREKLKHLVTTKMTEGKCSWRKREKRCWMD